MTKKGNGLVKQLNEALSTPIKNGKYKEVLDRWGLSNESRINPPGLLPGQAA
ncbi:hypothetical protein [Nonomuraea sp. NPDC049784]|uniref:hypothetical protein n=1 Tax=Nonomuraea sp. NPDC049784 TaxID=3154361 RepID=UPI0033DDAA33